MEHYIRPEDRKYHYWRGFRSACIVLFPVIGAFMYLSYQLVGLLVK